MNQGVNYYKANFDGCSSEYLIEKRALGDELADEAHAAIEQIFAERGEKLPPRPSAPINLMQIRKWRKTKSAREIALGLVVLIPAMILIEFAAKHWGLLIILGYGVYWILNVIRKRRLTSAERKAEEKQDQIENEGLTELMVAAADGNYTRATELLAFGAPVNAISLHGHTALMYAAKNGHLAVVEILVQAGANIHIASDKRSTASSLARKFGHTLVYEFLATQGGR